MRNTSPIGIAIAYALSLTCCGSIVNGSTETVQINSNVPGAKVIVDNESKGTAPTTVDLSRKGIHTVRVEKEGYQPIEQQLDMGRRCAGRNHRNTYRRRHWRDVRSKCPRN